MAMVAVCTDTTQPAEAATFSSCTSVAWTDSSNVVQGLFDGLTIENALEISGAIIFLWSLAFCIRLIVIVVRRTRV
jgi:hypothetical protein